MLIPKAAPSRAERETTLISVIIPAVNESASLPEVVGALRASHALAEVMVVDARSADDTAAVARAAGATIIACSRQQRAHQLNLGARHACGETLLFLHADTLVPEGALDQIEQALRVRSIVGGAFTRRYASPSPLLRATCRLAHLRNCTVGWHLGDQAMFVRSSAFFQLGGFREVDRFEDLDFSRRLKRFGHIVTLSPAVISSARRFAEAGAARRTLRDLGLTARYLTFGLEAAQPGRAAPLASLYEAGKSIGHL